MNPRDVELPADVIAHATRGDKIAAIKILREQSGLSLKDAKAAIEAHLAGSQRGAPPFAAHEPQQAPRIPRAAIVALENGRMIEAIKHYRETSGAELKDCNEALSRHLADNPVLHAKFKAAAAAASRRALGKFAGILFVLSMVTVVYLYATGQLQ